MKDLVPERYETKKIQVSDRFEVRTKKTCFEGCETVLKGALVPPVFRAKVLLKIDGEWEMIFHTSLLMTVNRFWMIEPITIRVCVMCCTNGRDLADD